MYSTAYVVSGVTCQFAFGANAKCPETRYFAFKFARLR